MLLTQTVQSGDWKNEKHVPVLHAKAEENVIKVKAVVGEEIEHPNTFEHHIAWIKLFFQPEGAKFPVEIACEEFKAHGEEELFTVPCAHAVLKAGVKGTLYALSYCNIHGLWENSLEI